MEIWNVYLDKQSLISFADQKNNFLMVLALGLSTLLMVYIDSKTVNSYSLISIVFVSLAGVLFLIFSINYVRVLFARYKPTEVNKIKSVISFIDISKHQSQQEYFANFKKLGDIEIKMDIAYQTYTLSKIVAKKFEIIRMNCYVIIGMVLLLVGFVLSDIICRF